MFLATVPVDCTDTGLYSLDECSTGGPFTWQVAVYIAGFVVVFAALVLFFMRHQWDSDELKSLRYKSCPSCGTHGTLKRRRAPVPVARRPEFSVGWQIATACTAGLGFLVWLTRPKRRTVPKVMNFTDCESCHTRVPRHWLTGRLVLPK